MIKIGIITYHFVNNYGACMQAWALQQYLIRRGFASEIIDYRPSHLEEGGTFFCPKSFRDIFSLGFLILLKIRHVIGNFSQSKGLKKAKFEEFHKRYFVLSSKKFFEGDSLEALSSEYDLFICGSDQIWNSSRQYGIDENYFLNFVKEDFKKVSYAASFGKKTLDNRYSSRIRSLLKNFKAISIREPSGIKVLREIGISHAEHVLDPTLLIGGDYENAIEPSFTKPYAFSYVLRSKNMANKVNLSVSKLFNLEIISSENLKGHTDVLSPWEWVGHFKKAKYIITNSYHGTLFSIIFKKPFIFVALSGKKVEYNERAVSLLSCVGLENNIVTDCDPAKIEEILENTNFKNAYYKLSQMRYNSEKFVDDVIKSILEK